MERRWQFLIVLQPMNDYDFKQFLEVSIDSYAEEKASAGNWKQEEAYEKSKQEFERLLPEGRHTEDHFLYTIVNQAIEEKLGSLWVKVDNEAKEAFIYEFAINEDKQGRGFGTEAIKALEVLLEKKDIEGLSLHVFGHNTKAIRLYERLGFKTTNINMKKSLQPKSLLSD